MEREGKKFGLGSSGSVVVLVVKALLALYNLSIDQDLLFKLASAVLLKRGDNGSMGDLACIVAEDLVLYQSFDRQKVAAWLEEENLVTVLERDWGFSISHVQPDLECDFLVGWTKEVAVSSHMVQQIKQNINQNFLSSSKEWWFLGRSLGAGESRKNYRASRSSQQAFRRLERRYLHTFAQTTKKCQPRLESRCVRVVVLVVETVGLLSVLTKIRPHY